MRLKTLQVHGFKSFADRTTLDFRDGVTAIVGSNGCGKSNIADAIRWVLGEQRASAVRGSKMDEVIFQGTVRRRPLNFAEVSLLFDNQSGRVPVPQTELEVARKVFREGGSEYALNRTACRLRDVQGLFRDTGLGSNAYAVIEATMMETLLSDRAEERRTLFEEAAGIGKYKDSRRAATRRLEAANADLVRLDDLIAEIESKVRALSRQKRRAERHHELQARRLDLELAIAHDELSRLEEELRAIETERQRLDEAERVAAADRSAAEAVLEERRIEAAELGRQRTQRSASLDAVRTRLDSREREVLLAEERGSHAQRRIGQLAEERITVQKRIGSLSESIEAGRAARDQLTEAVRAARERAEGKIRENVKVREALAGERAATAAAAEDARALARDIAMTEGERASAERRGSEAGERQAQLDSELERLYLALAQMTDQTELWETQAEEAGSRLTTAIDALDTARAELNLLRAREHRSRDELREAEDRLSSLAAQVDARDALESAYEGFAPAVSAIMAARERFPGVHKPLADYLPDAADAERAKRVEAYLGPLLQALVVDDLATARAIRSWFRHDWSGGGSLLLLPIEAAQRRAQGVAEVPADGQQWVELLLSELVIVSGDPLLELTPGATRVGPAGEVIDSRGIVKFTDVRDGHGILARREALARLRRELGEATHEREARLHERNTLREALAAAEARLQEAEEQRRQAEALLRAVELDVAEYRDRRGRLQRERDDAETARAGLETAAEDAAAKLVRLAQHLAQLARAVESAAGAESDARLRLSELETRWDAERDEEAELRVALARAEADLREAERGLRAAENDSRAALSRQQDIDAEVAEVRENLEALSSLRGTATEDIEELFQERDRESGALTLLDARLAEVDSELAELGERARAARRQETESAEQRHRLELRGAESRSSVERVRERIEVEWGRPWSALIAEATPVTEGDIDGWRRELRETTERLDGLGPVNMLAVEEHSEEQRRLDFLLNQRNDLLTARDNLSAAIRQINRTAREIFESTFKAARLNFERTFQSLFEGGECDLSLTDPDDPLESAIEIHASPKGKRTQRIHLLSGGERALTALALLFALYLVKPSPFCVLDEVDAPLDEANIGRFIRLLRDFKHETQFIVITHNPLTMEAADWIYGVTMEEPGVSSIVGVELLGVWAEGEPVALQR